MAAFAGQVDTDTWPLVVLEPSPYATQQSLDELFGGLTQLLKRRERFCLLGDFTGKGRMDLPEVRKLQRFLLTTGHRMDELVAGFGLAVPSPMVRGAIKFIFETRPPRFPYAIVRSLVDAKDYLGPYLEELSLLAPIPVRDSGSMPLAAVAP